MGIEQFNLMPPQEETSPTRESVLSSELQTRLKLIDETVFPDKPLDVRLDEDTEFGAEASHDFDDNDPENENEHFYTVYKKGIGNNLLTEEDVPEKEVLRIALHEVRHRVQRDMNTQMISIDDLRQFMVENPKTPLEAYFSSLGYKEFIDYASSKSANDFDAMVVEDIAMKLLNGNYSDENIKRIADEIIKQPSGVILERLKNL